MGNKHLSCRKSSPRLVKYDYSSPGLYFITICTGNHLCYFGKIENGKMILNEYGQMAVKFLEDVPCHYKGVKMDEFVVMPNHIHAIIDIVDVGTEHCSVPMFANGTCSWIEPGLDTESGSGTEHCSVPTADTKKININKNYGLLSKIVKSFKNTVTSNIRKKYNDFDFQWQRSYYDHIIRNENEYARIKAYIINNPVKWEFDIEYKNSMSGQNTVMTEQKRKDLCIKEERSKYYIEILIG